MRDVMNNLGHPNCRGVYVHLYINGLYWGLYNLTERPDENFAARTWGGKPSDYDARNSGNVLSGDEIAWKELFALANAGIDLGGAGGGSGDGCAEETKLIYVLGKGNAQSGSAGGVASIGAVCDTTSTTTPLKGAGVSNFASVPGSVGDAVTAVLLMHAGAGVMTTSAIVLAGGCLVFAVTAAQWIWRLYL